MTDQPLLSVIIPVYKAERSLRRCVDSLLCQLYTNLEIWLVDDGSPDGSPAICDDYAARDRRVHVIHQPNQGAFAARNAGLDAAGGAVGVLTDTGYVTDEAADILEGVDLAVLEANHDIETLRSGPYPYYLKQRILGAQGHLSNEDAARFAAVLAQSGTSEIILAHLSRENNTPAMAQTAVERALSAAGVSPLLSVAPRDCLGPAHTVSRRSVCRR